jgi:hypothetical protein
MAHRADSSPWPRPIGQRGMWRLAGQKVVSASVGRPNPQPKPALAQQNAAHLGSTHDHKVVGWPMPVARGARALGAITVHMAGTVARREAVAW